MTIGPATRILIGLVAGLLTGAALDGAAAERALSVAEPVGAMWLNALKMTIVPLVFALVVNGIASARAAAEAGGVAAKALGLFVVMIACTASFGAAAAWGLLEIWAPPAAAAEALRQGVGTAGAIPETPPLGQWLQGIVPDNPVKAAADGAMLPLVLFAVVFGFALARLAPERREPLAGVFATLAETMLVIVHWVLLVAPIGVFALALVVGARTGLGAAGALAHYVIIVSLVCLGVALLAVPFAVIGGRMGLGRFLRAAAPVQVVAISTQSSLACLPAMIEGMRGAGVSARVAGLVLPLAVSLLRVTSPAGNMAVALYVARLNGVDLSFADIAAGAAVAGVISFGLVSLPSATTFLTALVPIALTMGVPVEMLPLLVAIETLPDISRTIGNVMGDMAATAFLGRDREEGAR